MTASIRLETTLCDEGGVTVTGLPFRAGEQVEVVMRGRKQAAREGRYPLHGTPIRYLEPFGSVAEGEWENDNNHATD